MHQTIEYQDSLSLPPKGHVTIGESNSQLVHVSGAEDPKLHAFIKKHGGLKAALTMPSRNTHTLHHHNVNAALEELLEETRTMGIIPQPILDRFDELIKEWDWDAILDAAGTFGEKARDIYNSFKGSYNTIIHHDKLAKLLIRKIAWHPHRPLLAIALWNDSVWVYDLSLESWHSCGLSYPTQSQIMSLHWKPMSGVVLAIGCKDGVALWHVFQDHTPSGIEATWAEPAQPLKDRPSQLLSETYNAPSQGPNHGRDTAYVGLSRFEDLDSVDQLAWDPRGELLAVASTHSSTVYIREGTSKALTELRLGFRPKPSHVVRSVESLIETLGSLKKALGFGTQPDLRETTRPTHEHGVYGPAVCCMSWSPCGKYLLVGYLSEVARIYETGTWEYGEMKDLKGAIQSACWTPDGYNLIYSLQGDDVIRAIHFERRAGKLTWIPLNFVKMSFQYGDIEMYKSALRGEDADGEHMGIQEELWKKFGGRRIEDVHAFGPIEDLALDPSGERLVVRFRDTELLGVVLVRPTGTMLKDLDIFMPTGFIEGPGWSGEQTDEGETTDREPNAVTMSFTSHHNGGSMLALAWESGRINFMPFYYLTQKEVESL